MNINATMLGQSIAFFVFVWFCRQYIWPIFIDALAERQKKIADGLEAASEGEKSLELAQEKIGEQMKDAKVEASVIIDQANKRALQIVEDAKDQARDEGQRLLTGAQAEIEQEVNRAKEQLRSQVAAIAIAGAEKILASSIDESAHSKLAEELAASL